MRKHCRANLFSAILLVILLAQASAAFATEDFRSMMLAAEAPAQNFGSLSQRAGDFPLACSPDGFVSILKGEHDDASLQNVWTVLAFARSGDGQEMIIDLPGGGGITFPCTDEYIWRQSFPDIQLLGKPHDAELVCFGVRDYYNFAFVFLKDVDGWQLIDCLYTFDKPVLQFNTETAWLVGEGILDASQEGRHFVQWYNLLTRRMDVSFLDWGSQVAEWDNTDRYDTRVLSRSAFSTHTFQDENGRDTIDCALKVVKYLCLVQYHQNYTDDEFAEQRDALTQVDIYRYSQETHALSLAGSWRYENASPAFIENGHYSSFLDNGMVAKQ